MSFNRQTRFNFHEGEGKERILAILQARDAGITFKAIGERFNISAVRARQLYIIAERMRRFAEAKKRLASS